MHNARCTRASRAAVFYLIGCGGPSIASACNRHRVDIHVENMHVEVDVESFYAKLSYQFPHLGANKWSHNWCLGFNARCRNAFLFGNNTVLPTTGSLDLIANVNESARRKMHPTHWGGTGISHHFFIDHFYGDLLICIACIDQFKTNGNAEFRVNKCLLPFLWLQIWNRAILSFAVAYHIQSAAHSMHNNSPSIFQLFIIPCVFLADYPISSLPFTPLMVSSDRQHGQPELCGQYFFSDPMPSVHWNTKSEWNWNIFIFDPQIQILIGRSLNWCDLVQCIRETEKSIYIFRYICRMHVNKSLLNIFAISTESNSQTTWSGKRQFECGVDVGNASTFPHKSSTSCRETSALSVSRTHYTRHTKYVE